MVRISETQKKLGLILALIVGALAVYFGIVFLPTASNQGYAPVQPIPFSHKLHAGKYHMPCLYCHSSAEKSRHASIPSLNVCMNCHSVVKTDSKYIQQITQAYKAGKPIEWVRVHELPDHVYFPHKQHLAKGLQCQACHGDVAQMERVEQKAAMTMGFCIECHRKSPRDLYMKGYLHDPKIKDPTKGPVAPTNCSTCHY